MKQPLIDCHAHIGVDPAFYLNGEFPYAMDYRAHLDQMRCHGIVRSIVFPFVSYFGWPGLGLGGRADVRERDFSVPYAFENRRMMREIFEINPDTADAALPFVIVDPARKVGEQLASLRELKGEFPIRGIKIQATMIESPIRELLGDGRGLVDLAREWDVPMLIHSSIASADVWSQASDILDVAEASADVRFCLAHSCRFDVPSLERLREMANTWFDCSAHCIHCDGAAADMEFVAQPERRLETDYSRPSVVMKALYDFAPDRMMWGSDAPFYSYAGRLGDACVQLRSSYEREVAALELLSDEAKAAVMHDNIVDFLGAANV